MTTPSDDGEWIATQGLVIRLGTLEKRLQQALAEYTVASTLSERRGAIGHSLSAVVDFVRSFHPTHDPTLAAPLVELVAALLDLDRGEQPPLIRAAPITHRPPEALSRVHIKAYAAATLDRLLSTGTNRRDAAARVASVLSKRGYRLDGRRGAPNANTVIGWRNELIGYSGGGTGPRAFRKIRPAVDEMSGDEALATLDRFLATVILKNPPS